MAKLSHNLYLKLLRTLTAGVLLLLVSLLAGPVIAFAAVQPTQAQLDLCSQANQSPDVCVNVVNTCVSQDLTDTDCNKLLVNKDYNGCINILGGSYASVCAGMFKPANLTSPPASNNSNDVNGYNNCIQGGDASLPSGSINSCASKYLAPSVAGCVAGGTDVSTCVANYPAQGQISSPPQINTNTGQANPPSNNSPSSAPLPPPGTPGGSTAATNSSCAGLGLQSVNGVCLPKNPYGTGLASSQTLVGLISQILKGLLFLSGIIAVIFVIVGGFWYLTSGGSEEQVEKGKSTLVNAIIGLVVVILAYTIVAVISNALTQGISGGTSMSNSQKIS